MFSIGDWLIVILFGFAHTLVFSRGTALCYYRAMHVIGTAGHVDHGKSSLVKALSGINPDLHEGFISFGPEFQYELNIGGNVERGVVSIHPLSSNFGLLPNSETGGTWYFGVVDPSKEVLLLGAMENQQDQVEFVIGINAPVQ